MDVDQQINRINSHIEHLNTDELLAIYPTFSSLPEEIKTENIKSKLFLRRLKFLYKIIDESSHLLWNHDNSLGVKKRRSEIRFEDNQLKWKDKDTTQTGYGEITAGSMTNMFNLFQNISVLLKHYLPHVSENLLNSYDMNSNSAFLDIGSGFGKPNYHAALQTGCISKGVEVVPARAEFCIDFFWEHFSENKNFFQAIDEVFIKKNETGLEEEKIRDIIKETKQNNLSYSRHTNILKRYSSQFKFLLNGETYGIAQRNNNIMTKKKNIKETKDTSSTDTGTAKISNETTKNTKVEEENYTYLVKFNTLDDFYFTQEDFLKQSQKRYVRELPIEVESKANKGILVNTNKYCFSSIFFYQMLEIKITDLDDYISNLLEKMITNSISTSTIEQNILLSTRNFNNSTLKHKSFFELIPFVNNTHYLDLINTINTSKTLDINCNYVDFTTLGKNIIPKKFKKVKAEPKKEDPATLQLIEEMNEKERIIIEEENQHVSKDLLHSLCYSFNENWADSDRLSFKAEDATKCKFYSVDKLNDKGEEMHFTHIYAYNKLMSKECRGKIAQILNNTNYKVLAWYSNPLQTKNSGLRNFDFVCKFPMQSTSTEKFCVYVYVKRQW